MARAAAEFLKRWTEGFQSGRAGRVERDQRLAKESDRQGLMALNADVEALVGQTGRPLEMGEWGQLLAKHGRSMTDAEPFVRAGLFAKPQTGADLLRRQLDETRLKAEQTKLDRLLNPQPERPQFIPGSEGQVLQGGQAVNIPGFRRQSPIAGGDPAAPRFSQDGRLLWDTTSGSWKAAPGFTGGEADPFKLAKQRGDVRDQMALILSDIAIAVGPALYGQPKRFRKDMARGAAVEKARQDLTDEELLAYGERYAPDLVAEYRDLELLARVGAQAGQDPTSAPSKSPYSWLWGD